MREVAHYTRKEIAGSVPLVQPQMKEPQFYAELANHINQFEQRYSEQAKQKYALQLDTARKQEINRIANENKGNPKAMENAFRANCDGLSETITNDDLKERFNQAYLTETLPYLNRAQVEKQQRLDEENAVATLNNIKTTKDAMLKSVPDLWSNDPVVLQSAGNTLKKGLADIASALQTRKGDGSYLLSAETVATGIRPYVDELGKHIALSHIEKSADKQQAIQDLLNGTVGINIDDGNGSVFQFNIKDAMTAEAYEQTKTVIESKVADAVGRQALDLHNEDSEKALEYIKASIPKGYDNRDALIETATAEYMSRLNMSQRINHENKLLSNAQLAEDLTAALKTNSADSLELDERILNIEDAGTRQAFRNYRAQEGNVMTDPATFVMLSKMAKESPNTFADTDLTHYIDHLSQVDMKALQGAQLDIYNKKKGGETTGKYTEVVNTSDHVNRYLKLIGIDNPKDNPEEAYKAKQRLEIAINDYEMEKYGGKQKATTQDIDTIIMRMAGNFKERDWVFDNDVKLAQMAGQPVEARAKVYQPFNLIEGDDLASLNSYLANRGIVGDPTTNKELKKLYEGLFPAVLAQDRETIDFLISKYKGNK